MSAIDIAYVIRWLESQGRRDMASEVRELKRHSDSQEIWVRHHTKAVIDLEKRLEKYEPKQKYEPVNNWTGD